MNDPTRAALLATERIRQSRGYGALPRGERSELDRNLSRIGAALAGRSRSRGYDPRDPFAIPLETPADLRTSPVGTPPNTSPSNGSGSANQPVNGTTGPEPSRPPSPTEVLGQRAASVLGAVDFTSFVAGLIQGTFQAIVDASIQQVREYARLVADISKSVDEFTRDNVTDNQARDYLAERHAADLELVLPGPGEKTQPRLVPRESASEEPGWLADYGLAGQELSEEVTEGALISAGRRAMGEDRLRTLATMVLMGINRIVVDNGEVRAKLQFHARAKEKVSAEVVAQTGGQQLGIAGNSGAMQSAVTTMVSTVDVNAQSDISIKADLVGEVAVRFRSETFDLQRFADSNAIALISRHAHTPAAPTKTSNASSTASPASPTEDGGAT